MKRLALSALILAFGMFEAAPTFASQLDIRVSPTTLAAVCTNIGGDFRADKTGAYGCQNDCGVSGDTCTVICEIDRSCIAEAPGVLVSEMNVREILLNLYSPLFENGSKAKGGKSYYMSPFGGPLHPEH